MPELPEITTIKLDLQKEILNKKVVDIVRHKNFPLKPSKKEFQKEIIGHKVIKINNIGKLLLIKMSSKKYISIHLGMTGLLLFNKKDPYVKLSFKFGNESELSYSTIRQLGFLEIWTRDEVESYRENKGKSILDKTLTEEEFVKLFKDRRGNIKNALLNQKIISGIGNIYANDALYLTGINPKLNARKIPKTKLGKLFNNLKDLLKEGIKNRGSSIDRYRDIYGKKGTQQNYFRVYGKEGKSCKTCGTIIEKIEISGRSTFYCKKCQPENFQKRLL